MYHLKKKTSHTLSSSVMLLILKYQLELISYITLFITGWNRRNGQWLSPKNTKGRKYKLLFAKKKIQVPVFANWASLWWQRNCLSKSCLKHLRLPCLGSRCAVGCASHGLPHQQHEQQRLTPGLSSRRDGPKAIKTASDSRNLTGAWGNKSKEETKQKKINTTASNSTHAATAFSKAPQGLEESTCRQHTRVTLSPSPTAPPSTLQLPQLLMEPQPSTSSNCAWHAALTMGTAQQGQGAHPKGPWTCGSSWRSPAALLHPSMFIFNWTKMQCKCSQTATASQPATTLSTCSSWNTGRNQKVFFFKYGNEARVFRMLLHKPTLADRSMTLTVSVTLGVLV